MKVLDVTEAEFMVVSAAEQQGGVVVGEVLLCSGLHWRCFEL